jgi:hypothetical protein
MNERFNILPSHDDFAKIVTRPELEDALQGIGQDCGNLQQPTERVVIEMSSQTCLHYKGNEKILLLYEIRVLSQK